MLNNVFQYLRINDWIDSKIPFMLSVALFSYLYNDVNMSHTEVYISAFVYFLYISMFAAFSYVMNDFADMEIDKRAGKQKVIFMLPRVVIVVSIVLMMMVGILPMFFIVNEKAIFLGYTLLLYAMGAAYSAPCLFRFKEKGVIGLIECSMTQKCLPLIALTFLFPVDWIYFVFLSVISFVNGLRYILIHQAVDYDNDVVAGVKTFVSEGNNKYRTYIIIAFIAECILFFIVLLKLGTDYSWIYVILLFYCIFEKITAAVVGKYMGADIFCTFTAVPLEALYNIVFPVLIAVLLTMKSFIYFGFIVFFAVLTFRSFLGKVAFVSVYIKIVTGAPIR